MSWVKQLQNKPSKTKKHIAFGFALVLVVLILVGYMLYDSPYEKRFKSKDPAFSNLDSLRNIFEDARSEANIFVAPVGDIYDSTQ